MSSRTRSDFGTLADRTAAPPAGIAPAPTSAAHGSEAAGTPTHSPDALPDDSVPRIVDARHVWVDGGHAGLLLAWRRLGVWQGRVFWCPPDAPEPALDWIDQQRLQPR